jgi:hypothetical protein
VGAASGTIIGIELGLLWPRFMAFAGGVIGLPFSLEGAAFFIEAIFVGIYLYGWDRLSPRAHWLWDTDRGRLGGIGVFYRHGERVDERAARLSDRARSGDARQRAGRDVQSRVGDRDLAHGYSDPQTVADWPPKATAGRADPRKGRPVGCARAGTSMLERCEKARSLATALHRGKASTAGTHGATRAGHREDAAVVRAWPAYQAARLADR